MNIKVLCKQVYSHFFQTMPGEMTMKGFWNSYRFVAKQYLNGHYDLAKLRPTDGCKCNFGGVKISLSIGIVDLRQLHQ